MLGVSYFRKLLVITLFVFMSGCMAQPKVLMLGEAGNPKTESDNIDIFYTKIPEQGYVEIARIEVGDTNDEYSLNQILVKARSIGADGVIIIGRSGSYGPVIGSGTGYTSSNRASTFVTSSGLTVSEGYGLVAIAIRYN